MKTKYKLLIIILIIFIGMQFFGPEKNLSAVNKKTDFMYLTNPEPEISNVLSASCYNCHSNYTYYPWYNRISPISYWLDSHVREGKEHLNFSEWAGYPNDKKIKLLDEIREEVQER